MNILIFLLHHLDVTEPSSRSPSTFLSLSFSPGHILYCFVMLNNKEATRFQNSFARESRALLGTCDGPALAKFISNYNCGDYPIDSDGELRVYKAGCTYRKALISRRTGGRCQRVVQLSTVSIKTMNDYCICA